MLNNFHPVPVTMCFLLTAVLRAPGPSCQLQNGLIALGVSTSFRNEGITPTNGDEPSSKLLLSSRHTQELSRGMA